MALGVLNNLSAIYAENNLNNTNASLQTVLQQLSSGSRINSGADDAAGLSLVNGLAANSAALTQSETNSTEGAGLLQVADGALSQVTSLLNRAVTLATEASNGTLNSTQEAAANQEYQSILAEVSNIGSTTTYNQEQVFTGEDVAIYTGDSSQAGASVDNLNIRTLTESGMGDTDGAMSYGTGDSGNEVFIDLGAGATVNDALGGSPAITLPVTAATSGTSGSIVIDTLSSSGNVIANTVNIGGTSGFADTADGLINAINTANLGVTASFTTAAVAGAFGSGGATTDGGIMITGSAGVESTGAPSSASYSGAIAGAKTAADYMSGSLTLQVGSGSSAQVTMAEVAAYAGEGVGSVTLTQLEQYINADTALGVTASINGSDDLLLSSTVAGGDSALKVTSNLTDNSLGTGTELNYTSTPIYSVGIGTETNLYDVAHTATAGTPLIATADITAAQTLAAAVLGNTDTGGSLATISYTDKAGISLSGSDLIDTADAQTALTDINTAIADVAAQDGYIGAQINTLNSISQVMSTQQENIVSAQNAVQATDYASATSNMSKYEILSQTGIAALAQANTVQQEVTKLLQ